MELIALVLIAVFFLLTCFFNGIETGLISLDRYKLEQAAKTDKNKKQLLKFISTPERIFGTALLGQNVSIVIVSSLVTVFVIEKYYPDNQLGTFIMAAVILIFCEVIPKSIFRDYAETLVPFFFPVLNLCYFFLRPFVKLVSKINNVLEKMFKVSENNTFQLFTKDDLAFLLSETQEDSHLQLPQKEMLEDALEFNELKAKNVMIPRMDIVAIPDDMCISEIIALAKKEGYTRYPVYHKTLDEVTGILIIYDLIRKIDQPQLKADVLKREALFVHETMDVDALLKDMQTKKKSMAVVVDSFGGTAGLVTIEDILEELVGEIDDEYDTEEEEGEVEIINDNVMLIKGFVDVDYLNDEYDLNLPEGDYETLGGLIINNIAKIPTQGQVINLEHCKIEVLQVTNRKIIKVRLTKTPSVKQTNGQ